MTIKEARQRLLFQLYDVYEQREASNIADWVMEHVTGWKKIDRLVNKEVRLSVLQHTTLENYTRRLKVSEPVQYVLQEAWFCGMKFFVNENVLIPRPETEELVDWIIKETAASASIRISDIGTGSGCIAVTLKKKLPQAAVSACDISAPALEIAEKNAAAHKTAVHFYKLDILQRNQWSAIGETDIIVSNPPYIPLEEKKKMNNNVVQYEPHNALFVEDSDALLFYRTLGELAVENLNANGSIFMEVHESFAQQTAALFIALGFAKVDIKKDMQGKERMVRARY